ncbi:MAG TPA: hypothetical protein PLF11_00290 [Bacillota bacterium]|nr:hypothetical protein [Dermatophilaceae bacterium]HOI35797.1 hypothetical protein [Bacillota bacterium]
MSTTPEKLCDITTHFKVVRSVARWAQQFFLEEGGWDGELHVEVWRNRGCVDLSVYTDVSGNRTQLLQVCGVDNDVVPYITNIRDAFNKGVDVFLAQFGSAAKTE